MKSTKNKNIFYGIVLALTIVAMLTGCNKQILDFEYTYDKAICNIGGQYKEIKIKKWTDYEGEQLQIIDNEGNTYLVSSMNCTLIKD